MLKPLLNPIPLPPYPGRVVPFIVSIPCIITLTSCHYLAYIVLCRTWRFCPSLCHPKPGAASTRRRQEEVGMHTHSLQTLQNTDREYKLSFEPMYKFSLYLHIPSRSFRKNKDKGNHLHRQESLRPYGYSSEPNSYRTLSQPSPSGLQPLESPHSYL